MQFKLIIVFKQVLFLIIIINVAESKNLKIVGGKAADIEQVPFQAVYYSAGDFVCSGSLISPLYVLTAAHCTYFFASSISVRLGSSDRTNDGTMVNVVRYYSHPNYNSKNYDYDFALLKLASPVKYSRFIQPAVLPDENSVLPIGTKCLVSGWGLTSFDDSLDPPMQLLSTYVDIVDFNWCKNQYQRVQQLITERMFCAALPDGQSDACLGDSGGPLICNNVLYGVISFGFGCAMKEYPGIYANISAVLPWIRKVARLNDVHPRRT